MKKSQREILDSSRQITRRGLMLAGIQVATVTTLALKMRSMQLDHAEEYRTLADGNSIKIRLLPPSRGLILDRNGIIIAGNEQNYRVTLTREEAGGDVQAVAVIVDRATGAAERVAEEAGVPYLYAFGKDELGLD